MSEGLELIAKVNGLTSGVHITEKQLKNGDARLFVHAWIDAKLEYARRDVAALRSEYEAFVIEMRDLDPSAVPPDEDVRLEEYFTWIKAQPIGARRCMEVKLRDTRRGLS